MWLLSLESRPEGLGEDPSLCFLLDISISESNFLLIAVGGVDSVSRSSKLLSIWQLRVLFESWDEELAQLSTSIIKSRLFSSSSVRVEESCEIFDEEDTSESVEFSGFLAWVISCWKLVLFWWMYCLCFSSITFESAFLSNFRIGLVAVVDPFFSRASSRSICLRISNLPLK